MHRSAREVRGYGVVDWDGKKLQVKLWQEQVKNSPDTETHKPVFAPA